MRCGTWSAWLVTGMLLSSAGCGLTHSMTNYATNLFTFRGTDYADPTEEEDPLWVTEAATEGRSGQARERDPDQWFRKYFMSEKARSIERNVGFD